MYIVITSIFGPTEAVIAFSKRKNDAVIVVGDKKTPDDWNCKPAIYLSIERQKKIGRYLDPVLPYNHYCRKMMGYLFAAKAGADLIADTDDDNIPKSNWEFPPFESEFDQLAENLGFVNIYQLYSAQPIWPRGLPLDQIMSKMDLKKSITSQKCRIGIWQGLADDDPDVDAIYRLTNNTPCFFSERAPVVLAKDTLCPFNSQNTLFRKELFPLLYLPTTVTFRFTDILRGLVAQPIMWQHQYLLGFSNATVVQKRNPHDYFKDFISEIPMYRYSRRVVEIASAAVRSGVSIADNLFNVYEALLKQNIVEFCEMDVLQAWLKDMEAASAG